MSKCVLAFDPGAKRMGWACIEETAKNKPPQYHGSGYFGLERRVNGSKPEPYQDYRLRLVEFWIKKAPVMFSRYKPDVVVAEIVPPVGGGNFVVATQSQLVSGAITVVQTMALLDDLVLGQIGATSVKKKVGGSGKATKVAVRNGVFKLMPYTEIFRKQWRDEDIFDISDAFAIGLAHLGYDVKGTNGRS
jgi:Holliday junction resolvasome RuvABC endonuclease subunit